MSEKPLPLTKEQEYYDKYRGYFEYSGFHRHYQYRIKVKNYNGNISWPLDKCPKCGYDLKKDPPISRGVDMQPSKPFKPWENYFGAGALYILPIVLVFLKMYAEALAAVLIITIAIAVIYAFISLNKEVRSVDFYYCPNCKELIYNRIPNLLTTKQTPAIVFSELEKLPGFKLE